MADHDRDYGLADDEDVEDFDDGEGDEDEPTGHAALLCISAISLTVRQVALDTLDDALRVAADHTCDQLCVGAHLVVHRNLSGQLQVAAYSDGTTSLDRIRRAAQNRQQAKAQEVRARMQAKKQAEPERINHQSRKTHCKNGHPYDEENTYWYTRAGGGPARYCRQCHRHQNRKSPTDG